MIFHSLEFLVFFVTTVTIYWALPHRWQNVLLLVASYMFYGWVHPWFLGLIFATTFIDYLSALGMGRWPARKKLFLWTSIVSNFGLLGFFKYFNFFVDNISAVAAAVGWHISGPVLSVLLPVGISFYTFQAISYTIDVYWGRVQARRTFIDLALFVSFFPHLVAGPIMRARTLLPQVEQPRRFSANAARNSTVLIVWGLFKKLVIADNVGVIANKVFALQSPDFFPLWAGVFAFCIQIYADFSAYTDIARGTAKWLGFDLVVNFDHPYLAVGPADFWRRWNISLTTWFRDYVFLPLSYALSRRWDGIRWLGLDDDIWIYGTATLVTFLLSGLWHGASWNYVLWGAYHGVLLALARAGAATWKPRRSVRRWLTPFRILGMFALTNLGWLVFRETDLHTLVRDLALSPFHRSPFGRQAGAYLFLLAALYSLPLWIHSLWVYNRPAPQGADNGPSATRVDPIVGHEPTLWRVAAQTCLSGVLFAAILILRSRTSLDFIYFRF